MTKRIVLGLMVAGVLAGVWMFGRQGSPAPSSETAAIPAPPVSAADPNSVPPLAPSPSPSPVASNLPRVNPDDVLNENPILNSFLHDLVADAPGLLGEVGRPRITRDRPPYLHLRWEIDGLPIEHTEMTFRWDGQSTPRSTGIDIPLLSGPVPHFPRELQPQGRTRIEETLTKEGFSGILASDLGLSWGVAENGEGGVGLVPYLHYAAAYLDRHGTPRRESFTLNRDLKMIRRVDPVRH